MHAADKVPKVFQENGMGGERSTMHLGYRWGRWKNIPIEKQKNRWFDNIKTDLRCVQSA
jgi:hypothetical protein